MKAKARGPARFEISDRSAVFQQTVHWRVTVSQSGFEAVRDADRRRVVIGWKTLIGAAMFYGGDTNGGSRDDQNRD